jgi:two-component system, OmpR family, sensor histidine kinase BaeS
MKRFVRSLRAHLLLANLIVAAVALGTAVVATTLVGPGYFAAEMGHRGGGMGSMMDNATNLAFDSAVRDALVAAAVSAILASIAVSLLVSGSISGSASRMARAARRIAGGHYAERVPEDAPGELGDLAVDFNAMSASLQATEIRRVELVGDVAHELRTPLSTLDGYLEGLEDGVVAANPDTWKLLRGETARLTRLVDDMQELWRAEAGQLSLRIETLDVAECARTAAERFAPQAAAGRVSLRTDVPAGLLVRADRDRLGQILGNYLSNALRHSPDGSSIEIRGSRTATGIVLAVTDHGPGLTPEQRALVFERFYRADAARTRSRGGSGIGLAIVRALAEAMDGRVRADSDGPGTGATFSVSLPAA